ncbi:hypothetical protein [Saccharopolyspora spinosa]|uniref:hypothetical protein n=1 Tax=Saccharopolyspora spinosa TaxID=60894 RepID=UPI001ED97693
MEDIANWARAGCNGWAPEDMLWWEQPVGKSGRPQTNRQQAATARFQPGRSAPRVGAQHTYEPGRV